MKDKDNKLSNKCLVLNTNWTPIGTTSVRNAFITLYRGAAKIVVGSAFESFNYEEFIDYSATQPPHGQIHTPSLRFCVPEVLVLTKFGGTVNGRVKLNLATIAMRDGFLCMYCGRDLRGKQRSLDHVIPRSKNGKHSFRNVVLSCVPCNNFKRNRTPSEAGMSLIKEPTNPNWLLAINHNNDKNKCPKSWLQFLPK